MSPELLAAVSGGELFAGIGGILLAIAAVITAIVGPSGIAALFRRDRAPAPAASPAAEVRASTPAIMELADALGEARDDIRLVKERVAALEGSVWRCSEPACPVRAQLHRGDV